MLDTKEGINRRKQLVIAAFKTYEHILTNNIALNTRMGISRAYVTSVFLYNSELWAMNKHTEHEMDVFHRKLLRRVLKVKWSYTIRNDIVYEKKLGKANGVRG